MEGVNTVAANNWSIVDLILLVSIGFSVVVGLWRGLVSEVMSLLGWVVSYTAAQWFGPSMAEHVPVGEYGGRVNVIAGMLVTFVVAWMLWALVSWVVTKLLRESALNAPDRVLGAVFGLLRGLLIALAVTTLVNMTPAGRWPSWQASRGVAWLTVLLDGFRPILPEQVVKFLPEQS